MPAQIIDKGILTSNLLPSVLVVKYGDQLSLYYLEESYAREGVPLPRSTLAQWVGRCGVQLQPLVDTLNAEMPAHTVLRADETSMELLKPGTGKTHRAYLWAYSPGVFEPLMAVVYDLKRWQALSRFIDDGRMPIDNNWIENQVRPSS